MLFLAAKGGKLMTPMEYITMLDDICASEIVAEDIVFEEGLILADPAMAAEDMS